MAMNSIQLAIRSVQSDVFSRQSVGNDLFSVGRQTNSVGSVQSARISIEPSVVVIALVQFDSSCLSESVLVLVSSG